MPRKPVFPHPTSTSNDIPRRQSQSQSSQPLPPFPLPLPSALRMGMDQPHAPPQLVSSSNPSQSQSQTQYRTISGSGPAPPSSNYRYETMQEEVYPGGGTGGGGAGSGADSFAASPEEWDELEDINGGRQSPLQLAPGSASGLRNNGSGKERKPIATRRRAVQSCSECRRRKIKCDKKFPCGPCILRQDEARCHEVGMAEKHIVASTSHHATTAELASVAHRLDALEAALIKNGTLTAADLDHFLRSVGNITGMNIAPPPSSTLPTAPASAGQNERGHLSHIEQDRDREATGSPHKPPTIPPLRHGFDTEMLKEDRDVSDDAVLTLEQIAFGRQRAIGGHNVPYFGTQHTASVGRQLANNDYHLAANPGRSGSIVLSSPVTSPNVLQSQPARKASMSLDAGVGSLPAITAIGHIQAPGRESQPNSRPASRTGAAGDGDGTGTVAIGANTNSGAGVGFSAARRYVDTLSYEEKMARMDALLDLMEPTDLTDLFWKKTNVGWRFLIKVMPSLERAKFCVHAFVDKVDWLHRCLHIPSFLRQCNDLWLLPPERIVEEMAMPFVAVYLTVCTLGLHFSDAEDVAKYFTPEEAALCIEQWYGSIRASMWGSDMMGEPTLEHVQAYVLLSVLMNNKDRASAAWGMLGLSVKIAQNIGLSRLGAEQQAPEGQLLPTWTGRWESLIQREVGRRVWWNLVFMEWSLAPSYYFSVGITPDQIKTALPGNIEDEDLIDGQPFRPKPLTVRTKMSYQLAKLKFSEFSYRQIWQANNSPNMPYSFILRMDAELRKTMLDLPSFFQPHPDARDSVPPKSDTEAMVEYYEKTTLNIGIHARMLRLHRPWLTRGYDDERFAYSKEQCIRAARAALRLMNGNDGVALFLEKWWIPLFYISVSGMVLIIDLLRTKRPQMHSSDTQQKIAEVKGCLDQMRKITHVSPSARATVRVMDFLMIEVEERRRPQSHGKRKAEHSPDGEEEGLQRAIKKLVRQAQLEADSPTQSIPSVNPTSPEEGLSRSNSREQDAQKDKEKDRPVFDAYPMPVTNNDMVGGPAGLPLSNSSGSSSLPAPATQMPTAGQSVAQMQPQQPNQQFTMGANGVPILPPNANQDLTAAFAGNMNGNGTGFDNLTFPPSTFSFPTDATGYDYMGTGFGPYTPDTRLPYTMYPRQPTPTLDPAIEQMLNSFFPINANDNSNNNNQNPSNNGNNNTGAANLNISNQATGANGSYDTQNHNSNNNSHNNNSFGLNSSVPDDFLNRVFSFSWDNLGNNMNTTGAGEVSDGVVGGFGGVPTPAQGQGQGQLIHNQGQGQNQGHGHGQGDINAEMMWGLPNTWGSGGHGTMG